MTLLVFVVSESNLIAGRVGCCNKHSNDFEKYREGFQQRGFTTERTGAKRAKPNDAVALARVESVSGVTHSSIYCRRRATNDGLVCSQIKPKQLERELLYISS